MESTVPVSELLEETYCCNGSSPDDIIITGMSGRFPACDNIEELSDGLYSMKCLTLPTEERWEIGSLGIECTALPILKDISGFDSDFFRIPRVIAHKMEPDQRLLLEVAYEAISDSGYDPEQLRGHKIGVYCASSNTDTHDIELRGDDTQYFSVCGLECMRANKISHCLDFVGPSYCMDAACSSSAVAVHAAFNDIRQGLCEAAVVCGVQITLNPEVSRMYAGNNITTLRNTCYPFEERAAGMVRAEAVVALFVQKAGAARRSYARIRSVQIRASGYSEEGIAHPSLSAQIELFNSVAAECKLDMEEVTYVECHGTGTHVGDPIEVNSVKQVYCKNRKEPLLIGTIKSNLGHSEAPSGLSSIVKAILAFETGYIAPNYDFKKPSPTCLPLFDGSLKVVSKPTPFTSDWMLINSFGFGGNIGQIVLQRTTSEKRKSGNDGRLPQLVFLSATCEDAASYGLRYVSQPSFNPEFFSLLNNLAFTDPMYKSYRGFALLNKEPQSEIKQCRLGKREVWFVLTGMGCQWPGMGSDLMAIESYARSILKSARILEPLGVDLLEIMKPESNRLSQKGKILPAFVGIAAIQIALVDVLRELGIEPDGIIGHSVGELVSAYADGCCTAEETILSVYWRGYCTEHSDLPDGAMAAVGMTWEEMIARCPKDVYAACHNAEDSVTISGLKKPVEDFTAQLKKENLFARVVDTYGYSFHSPVIHNVSTKLKPALDKVITKPKLRTTRWLSTSYSPEEWDKPEAKIADSSYFVNNLQSKVRFAEAAAFIPRDAITIEIGPHALLQSLLKRIIGSEASFIGLMRRNENNVDVLLSSIGKLYTTGLNPKISRLYPAPQYPVPRATPVLSNLIKWNHSTKFNVPKWEKIGQDSTKIIVDTSGDDHFVLDHCIDGRSLYPAAGYMYLAWVTLAKQMNKSIDQLPILIEDFMIHRASILSATDKKTFSISLLGVTGEFEIVEGSNVIASGRISSPSESLLNIPMPTYKKSRIDVVSGKEVYAELKINGYEYGPNFQAMIEASLDGSQGLLRWENKWIPYLDAHLVFFGLIYDSDKFFLPTGALSIKIDPTQHKKYLDNGQYQGFEGMPVNYEKYTGICSSPGVEIRKLKVDQAPRSSGFPASAFLEQINFVPYVESCAISEERKNECEKYSSICCEMAKRISVSSTQDVGSAKLSIKIDDFNIEKFLSSENERYVLLQVLQEFSHVFTSENFITDVKTIFRRYVNAAGDDLLYQTLHDEYPLRHILAIVMENSPIRMTMTEVVNGAALFTPVIADFIKTLSTSKVKFTLLHPEPEFLDNESLSARNIEVQTLKTTQSSRNIKNQNLVISSFFFGDATVLQSHVRLLVSMVQPKGFILLLHRERISPAEAFLCSLCDEVFQTQSEITLRKIFNLENLLVVSKKSDGFGSTFYLLRRQDNSQQYVDSVVRIKDGCYNEWVNELKDAFAQANDNENARLWVVAEDTPYNGIIGLVKCLNKEPGGERIRCVFLVKNQMSRTMRNFSLDEPTYSSLKQNDLFMNIYKDGHWGSFQSSVIPYEVEEKVMEHSYLNIKKYGDLSSFQWFELPIKYDIDGNDNKSLVNIYYSALNFKDVMIATGRLTSAAFSQTGRNASSLGLEFSGITADGRRVMCVVAREGLATSALVNPANRYDIPDKWSLEEAATVPVIYLTCYYALILRAGLSKGNSILIHSGTGGIGIAAIRIALSLNCKIFVTVGTNEKRTYLRKLFPEIDESHIFSSRDTLFEEMILKKTHGKGVDVILNSLADDKFKASVRCVATHGHFLEIGKYDLSLDRKIGLGIFLRNVSFHGVDLNRLLLGEMSTVFMQLKALLIDGIKKGVVQPLDRTVFQRDEAEDAFRYMASGKHMGKVLLKIRDEPSSGNDASLKMQTFKATPCTYFYGSKSYIVIGGLGGCGIELVKWMQQNGAHNVVLTSRHGVQSGYHRLCLQRWKESGMKVVVSTLDVSKRNEAKQLLEEVSRIAPIGGIFNSAVVLKDAFMENQTVKDFGEACAPKAEATKNLDEFSRVMCLSLDYFVCFSSISCGKGNAGQTNYGYANSVMERVCEQRRSDGLHGLCIQWGIIGDVGVVHRHMGEDAVIAGVVSQKITSCLSVLSQFLQRQDAVLSSYNILDDSKGKKMGKGDFLPQLAKVFGFKDLSEINKTRSFLEMGIDSMVGIELQQLLEGRFDLSLSMKELQTMTVEDLEQLVESAAVAKTNVHDQVTPRESQFILPDNLIAEKPIVKLNAATSGIPIFIIHYSETDLKKLQTLTEKLNCSVYGLQCIKNTPIDNLSTMGVAYLKDIAQVCNSGPIHLVGYRTAVTLTLQMAQDCLSNRSGLPALASVNILDGSLELVNFMLAMDETDLKAADETILFDYLAQYSDADLTKIKEEIEHMSDFEDKVSYIINLLATSWQGKFEKVAISNAVYRYIDMQKLMRKFDMKKKIPIDIAVVEVTGKLLPNDVSLVKASLSKICSGKVSINRIPGESNFLIDPETTAAVANVINNIIGCKAT